MRRVTDHRVVTFCLPAVISLVALLVGPPIPETEPGGVRGENDRPGTAQPLPRFSSVVVNGVLSPASQPTVALAPSAEDNGSISRAQPTGIGVTRPGITTTGTIDGRPHFYRIDAAAGATIIVHVRPAGGEPDPAVTLFDARGARAGFSDQRGNDVDPVLVVRVAAGGAYYAMIAGSGTGKYTASMIASPADEDCYAVTLRRGDVLGAAVTGSPDVVTVTDPYGVVVARSTGDASMSYPPESPLPRGRISTNHVAASAGRYVVSVAGTGGRYTLRMGVHRPGQDGSGRVQQLFIDFDGARVDPGLFASSGLPPSEPPGLRTLSPLREFLPAWGLTAADLVPLERVIEATVRRNLNQAIATAGRHGRSAVRVLSGLDGPDPFGRPDVTRLVLGGTIAETGMPTIGVAQSVDPGNTATAETAVVQLDVLSAPARSGYAITTYLQPSGDRITYLGEVLGDYLSHETGHLLGSLHTQPTGGRQGLMDNTDIARIVAGPDRVGGTADDRHIPFATGNDLLAAEGWSGTEDTANRTAAGLAF